MAKVKISDLRKSFGKVEVLKGINIDVTDGHLVALVGPSGCGKSTLLRMIAGLEEVVTGIISIGDRIVNHIAPKNRDIAMVFQGYSLYPHMTVRENMSFSLKLRGTKSSAMNQAVDNAAEILGLTALLDRYPRELSGGQRQRVAMGRAIVRAPQVFLFDEPLSNLDTKLRVQMRSEIRALQQRLGTTSIYVTHDQMEAMTMADQVVIMNAGRIEQTGSPLDVYDCPENVFVATFIGSPVMNMFEGSIIRRDSRYLVDAGEFLLPLPTFYECSEGQHVLCGIRPEHMQFVETESCDGSLQATVNLIEPTGATTHVSCTAGRHKFIAVFSERHPFKVSQAIRVKAPAVRLHLFDFDSGKRIRALESTTPSAGH
jgi:multiple sugar transport system ATP-binding protein